MNAIDIPVIVTRAQPGADQTAARLVSIGLRPLLAPVMSVTPDATVSLPDLTSISGVVFTSANGVRVFADRSENRAQTAWCVGPATAEAARHAGFFIVQESAGNARDLAAFIANRTAPTDHPLLHVANAAAKGDLKAALEAARFNVTFCPLYKMMRAAALPEATIKALKSEEPTIVLAHSEKGADAFVDLCGKLPTAHLTGVAISARAAHPLRQIGLKDLHIADAPNEDGLFNSLSNAVAILSA